MNQRLVDKVIVISGGTKGVGKQLAIDCAKNGAKVVIGGRDEEAGQKVVAEIKKYTDGEFVYVDLHDVKYCAKLFSVAMQKYGKVNGFVNYSGVTPVASLADCDEETYDEVFDVNMKAAFFCVQNAIQCMRQIGGGSIVLVGSAHAWSGQKDRAPYAITKGALLTMSEHIAHNYAMENIRCNYLTLGWTPTEGELALRKTQGISEKKLKEMAAGILPMGRMLKIEDPISAFIFYLSDDSAMVTGSNIRVTAGEYIS